MSDPDSAVAAADHGAGEVEDQTLSENSQSQFVSQANSFDGNTDADTTTTDAASTDAASEDGASTDGASTDGASADGASADGASADGADANADDVEEFPKLSQLEPGRTSFNFWKPKELTPEQRAAADNAHKRACHKAVKAGQPPPEKKPEQTPKLYMEYKTFNRNTGRVTNVSKRCIVETDDFYFVPFNASNGLYAVWLDVHNKAKMCFRIPNSPENQSIIANMRAVEEKAVQCLTANSSQIPGVDRQLSSKEVRDGMFGLVRRKLEGCKHPNPGYTMQVIWLPKEAKRKPAEVVSQIINVTGQKEDPDNPGHMIACQQSGDCSTVVKKDEFWARFSLAQDVWTKVEKGRLSWGFNNYLYVGVGRPGRKREEETKPAQSTEQLKTAAANAIAAAYGGRGNCTVVENTTVVKVKNANDFDDDDGGGGGGGGGGNAAVVAGGKRRSGDMDNIASQMVTDHQNGGGGHDGKMARNANTIDADGM